VYDIEKIYLYEVFDEFQCASSVDSKDNVWKDFCDTIWSVPNKRQIYNKYISFKVLDDTKNHILKNYS
jgi:hypothetical protein